MTQKNPFEEEFPSLKDKHIGLYVRENNMYYEEDIKDNCLDKQKVRESIIKFRDNIFDTGIMSKEDRAKLTIKFDILNDDLGL